MRIETVPALNGGHAFILCPWACKTVKVEGGYMCFESHADFETWKDQK